MRKLLRGYNVYLKETYEIYVAQKWEKVSVILAF